MSDASRLRAAELARVGAFIHGERILGSSIVAQPSLTQPPPTQQNWTIVGSGTAAACLIYAVVATYPYSAATSRARTSTLPLKTPESNTLPDNFTWRSVFIEDASPILARQNQIAKNANAIALLDHWLAEGGGRFDEGEARELQELRTALDEHRSSNRKLFP